MVLGAMVAPEAGRLQMGQLQQCCPVVRSREHLWNEGAGVLGAWVQRFFKVHPPREVSSLESRRPGDDSFHSNRHQGWEKRSETVQNCANTK